MARAASAADGAVSPAGMAGATPFGREARSPEEAARANIAAYEAMAHAAFPKPAVETLLAAFTALEQKSEE